MGVTDLAFYVCFQHTIFNIIIMINGYITIWALHARIFYLPNDVLLFHASIDNISVSYLTITKPRSAVEPPSIGDHSHEVKWVEYQGKDCVEVLGLMSLSLSIFMMGHLFWRTHNITLLPRNIRLHTGTRTRDLRFGER